MSDLVSMVLGIAGMAAIPLLLVRVVFGRADLAALFASPWSGGPRGVQEPEPTPFRFDGAASPRATIVDGPASRGASLVDGPSSPRATIVDGPASRGASLVDGPPAETPRAEPVRGRVVRARAYASR